MMSDSIPARRRVVASIWVRTGGMARLSASLAGMTRFLDDLPIGHEFPCGDFNLTPDEIIAFAYRFDPQPWHLDDALARETYFESLCASGLHSQGAAISLVVRAIADVAIVAGGSLHEARFFAPVRPAQRYSVQARWTEARASRSNPERGVASITIDARDEQGTVVMTCGVTYIVGRRPD
jgi:acyl dehydratase